MRGPRSRSYGTLCGVKSAPLALLILLLATPAALAADEKDPLLPSKRACKGATNVEAHPRTQRLAMHCLVNLVRTKAGRRKVRSSAALRHSATYKARRIAACKRFTHSPCGDQLAAPFHQAHVTKHRAWFVGENLGWGVGSHGSPRAIVHSWMNSAGHRDNVLRGAFHHVGIGIAAGAPQPVSGSAATYATNFGG